MELKEFQRNAIDKILFSIEANIHKETIVQSPTGSGKTIILMEVVKKLLEYGKNYTYIWLTPGQGELEMQSKSKFNSVYNDIKTSVLNDVLTLGFESKAISFINWEQVVNKKNIAVKEGDYPNLFDRITEYKDSGNEFIVIIDEEHLNATIKSREIIRAFNPQHIIRTSATANIKEISNIIRISDAEVIESGLIKKMVNINEGLNEGTNIVDQVEFLVNLAINKHNQIKSEFINLGKKIVPLTLIQVPPKSDDLIERIEDFLMSKGINYDNKKLAIWLSEKKENLDSIESINAEPEFLIMKQAIATGWDCPRAHILVKLRSNMTEAFEIQTIGRIRRMPEGFHYNSELLDSCYLFTLDSKYTESVKEALGHNAADVMVLERKDEFKDIKIPMEYKSDNPFGTDERYALKVIFDYLKKTYGLNNDSEVNKKLLTNDNYVFLSYFKNRLVTGQTESFTESEIKNLGKVSANIEIDYIKQSKLIKQVISNIGKRIGLSYQAMFSIFKRLFLNNNLKLNKILRLNSDDFYSFIINNEDKLKEDLIKATTEQGKQYHLTLEERKEGVFTFPNEFIFKYNSDFRDPDIYLKNIYYGYLSSAVPRSKSESSFEKLCEAYDKVSWWYKNGEKSIEYFSILYKDNLGKLRLFYPDYILSINNNIWIIETKGGISSSGQDENIDPYSELKFNALKDFAQKNDLSFGFVRYNKQNDKNYINNTGFTDDMSDSNWVWIERFNFDEN